MFYFCEFFTANWIQKEVFIILFVCDFESNIFFVECRERTWWKKYLIFCVNYFLYRTQIIEYNDNHEISSDTALYCWWRKTEKRWFLKSWKNEIILWNVLFCQCAVIIKQYVVWIDSSGSSKCSVFCALAHQKQKFAISTKLIFYLIFSIFSDDTFRSLINWFL